VDSVALEIVAEAEIAQHLEKGVMAGGITDIFQIIVLTAGPHTALRGGRSVIGALDRGR
jgi:hypothetical protein